MCTLDVCLNAFFHWQSSGTLWIYLCILSEKQAALRRGSEGNFLNLGFSSFSWIRLPKGNTHVKTKQVEANEFTHGDLIAGVSAMPAGMLAPRVLMTGWEILAGNTGYCSRSSEILETSLIQWGSTSEHIFLFTYINLHVLLWKQYRIPGRTHHNSSGEMKPEEWTLDPKGP